MKRLFLVGSPRSGTTLLQSFLAAHPRVVTLPETHFFFELRRMPRRLRPFRLGNVGALQRAQRSLDVVDDDLRFPSIAAVGHLAPRRGIVRGFVSTLDALAERSGATAWLEKTPRHLHHLDEIRTLVPDAEIIHVLRDGASVAASMHGVSTRSPDRWDGARTLAESATRWRDDVAIAVADRGSPATVFVRHEDLVTDPPTVLASLCDALGLAYDDAMISERDAALAATQRKHDPWNASVRGPVERKESPLSVDDPEVAAILSTVDISWCRGVVAASPPPPSPMPPGGLP